MYLLVALSVKSSCLMWNNSPVLVSPPVLGHNLGLLLRYAPTYVHNIEDLTSGQLLYSVHPTQVLRHAS